MYGELVSQRRSGTTSFHHFDALGSTDRLTDASANTLAAYLYKAFGEQSIVSGSSANRFTWVGKLGYYRQPDAADYWVRARILKPAPGRWLTRDPGPVSDGYLPNLPFVRRQDYPLLPHPLHTYNQWATWVKHRLGNRSLLDASLPQHLYAYCANNPLRLVDPSGRLHPAIVIGGVAISLFCIFNALRVISNTAGNYTRWRHCIVACAISRFCFPPLGIVFCYEAELLWEILWFIRYGHIQDGYDVAASEAGCICGVEFWMSCNCCCEKEGWTSEGGEPPPPPPIMPI